MAWFRDLRIGGKLLLLAITAGLGAFSLVQMATAQVDQVTQQNASSAEELASTAEEMSSQAEALQQLVGFFRVAGAAPARTFTAPRAPRPASAHAAFHPAKPAAPQAAPKPEKPAATDGKLSDHGFERF